MVPLIDLDSLRIPAAGALLIADCRLPIADC